MLLFVFGFTSFVSPISGRILIDKLIVHIILHILNLFYLKALILP